MTNSKFDNLFKNKPRKPEKEKISLFGVSAKYLDSDRAKDLLVF